MMGVSNVPKHTNSQTQHVGQKCVCVCVSVDGFDEGAAEYRHFTQHLARIC